MQGRVIKSNIRVAEIKTLIYPYSYLLLNFLFRRVMPLFRKVRKSLVRYLKKHFKQCCGSELHILLIIKLQNFKTIKKNTLEIMIVPNTQELHAAGLSINQYTTKRNKHVYTHFVWYLFQFWPGRKVKTLPSWEAHFALAISKGTLCD